MTTRRRATSESETKGRTATKILYKYRGLTNLEYALDIIVGGRMYASSFQDLNDPMEGSYIYTAGELKQRAVREIYEDKARWRILSLSETPTNMLMWSYYAEGHAGVVIGVELAHLNAEVQQIQYVRRVEIRSNHQGLAKQILCKKLTLWEHEKEHRVFIRGREHEPPFVQVKIREVIFGVATPREKRTLFEAIVRKFWPNAKVRVLDRDELSKTTAGDSRLTRELPKSR